VGAVVAGHIGVVGGANAIHDLPRTVRLGHSGGRLASETGSWLRNGVFRGVEAGLVAEIGGRPTPKRFVSQARNLAFQLGRVLGVIHGSLLNDLQQFFVR
jgi:hypothetical protein